MSRQQHIGAHVERGTQALSEQSLLPRLKHRSFEVALNGQGIPPEHAPLVTPWVGELLVTYAFEVGDQYVMASRHHLVQAGIDPRDVPAHAITNLKQRLGTVHRYERAGVYLVLCGGELEACLMLVDEFWQDICRQLGVSTLLASVPRRDRLLFTPDNRPEALTALREATAGFHAEQDDGHALSLQAMSLGPLGWRLVAN